VGAALLQLVLDVLETAAEPRHGGTQLALGIDPDEPREIRDREQQVADLGCEAGRRVAGGGAPNELGTDFRQLLLDLGHDLLDLRPVEPDRGGLLLRAERGGERRQGGRHLAEQGARLLLVLLDLLPLPLRGVRGRDRLVAEDVRVPAAQLDGGGAAQRVERVRAPVGEDVGAEDDQEQGVAQFLGDVVHAVGRDRVEDLVRLLDQVGRQGGERLLLVPRAAGFAAQAPQDVPQLEKTLSARIVSVGIGHVRNNRRMRRKRATA